MRILCLSADQEIAQLRCAVLTFAGFDCLYPKSKQEAVRKMQTDKFDVALVCHSLSTESAQALATRYKEHNPDGLLVYMPWGAWGKAPIEADLSIAGCQGPDVLTNAIRNWRDTRSTDAIVE